MSGEEKILGILTEMRSEIAGMRSEMTEMHSEMSEMRSDISDLKQGQAKLEQGQAKTNRRLNIIEANIADMKEDIVLIGQDTVEIRSATNSLVHWADHTGRTLGVPLGLI